MDIAANTFAPRRSAFVFGALGILLIAAGLACTPSFVAHFTSDGSVNTPWRVVQLHLARVCALAVGAALLSYYITARSFSKENPYLPAFLRGVTVGLSLIGLVVMLSPSLVERQVSPLGVLEDEQLAALASFRLATLTLGCCSLPLSSSFTGGCSQRTQRC